MYIPQKKQTDQSRGWMDDEIAEKLHNILKNDLGLL